ncbi:homolog to glycine cleavage system protein T [Natronomonas moolapensis 8.8.11]|uniref:Homolog to glycine cleavage system protein T n=1 Tax=Natronomonas moolapensis (strain DSM 18674 / CECT 7526 / JCM 14361 / 8.8.11) TaxID=268739 RepID=M1Y560_NATM8|nr:aminomethyltransferase family protein [Natronomonas moolapensis]CCQ37687.1 homolog to glycine cleavage system protein T [Natronomonas moolapensis 8.8.11]
MTVVAKLHESHGATFTERGGRRVVDHYGRPERVHRAVRNVVGTIEMGYGVLEVTGDDRVDFVDNAVSNRVPETDGQGVYALLLDAQGGIETELYVYNADEKLLCFVPPGTATDLAAKWSEKTFIQDVEVRAASDDFGVFGVHGPKATEKIASVLTGPSSPDRPLSFVRGTLGDWGVTVLRTDDLTGEEGYEVICAAEDAPDVFDALVNHGLNAAPFGYRTLEYLLLEAGTPLFSTELEGTVPNVLGLRNALDFEKGCYVGQEVVSKIENRGQPSRQLAGLRPDAVPDPGAAVFAGDEHVGEVTRGDHSPSLEAPIALAFVEYGLDAGDMSVRIDGEDVDASLVELPFVEGSSRSRRLPEY